MVVILKHQRNRIIFAGFFLIVGGLVLLMSQCIIPGFKCERQRTNLLPKPVTLDVWNVFEDKDIYKDLIQRYQTANPNVTINYEMLEFDEYRRRLIESFAAGEGPDIFVIHNTWLPMHKGQIAPAPPSLDAAVNFDSIYPDAVKFDFTRIAEDGSNFVYALPLAIETLGIFYNEDYFEAQNITSAPKIWDEVVDYARLFTRLDEQGNIRISGASLGTINNINRSTDIVGLLMMQGGARMNNDKLTEAAFDEPVLVIENGAEKKFYPGRDALNFYAAFGDKTKAVYSWNDSMSYSIDAFVEGRSVMMVNYPHHIPTIKAKAPHLNFKTAPVPQLKDRKEDTNYASYWGFTVAKNSDKVQEAWDFIDFLASPDSVKTYTEKTHLPVARKDLIFWQQQDPELKHFATQILTARSWYQGDSDEAEKAIRDMVESLHAGIKNADEAVEDAAARITSRIKQIRDAEN